MIYLDLDEVIELHDTLIDKFGGLKGIRDKNLLESALTSPTMSVFGEDMHPSTFDKAAAYLYYLSRNHPFLDGNKRTASSCTLIFLRINGENPQYNTDDFLEFVVDVAQGKKEISLISDYLENMCKK